MIACRHDSQMDNLKNEVSKVLLRLDFDHRVMPLSKEFSQ